MKTMQAFAITEKSYPNELSLPDIPIPKITKNEVPVHVEAMGEVSKHPAQL